MGFPHTDENNKVINPNLLNPNNIFQYKNLAERALFNGKGQTFLCCGSYFSFLPSFCLSNNQPKAALLGSSFSDIECYRRSAKFFIIHINHGQKKLKTLPI